MTRMKNTGSEGPQALFNPMLSGSQQIAYSYARLMGHAAKAALNYQTDMLAFFKHRYEQHNKLIDDLVHCDNFGDASACYADFCQNAMSEYSKEAGKVAQMNTHMADETIKKVREETEELSDRMTARSVA